MALQGNGTLHNYQGSKCFVSIPASVWRDSAFPFKDKEKVMIIIDGDQLLVRKTYEEK